MSQVSIPKDEEFKKLLKEVLDKPDGWYDERVDRAVRGAISARRGLVQVPRKGRRKVR
jgi:DNA-binding phage protein